MNKASLRRFCSFVWLAVSLLAVAACSNTKDDAYKHSKALPSLEMPPDLISPAKDASTAVPELPPSAPAGAAPAAAAPPAATDTLHVERQGAARWLVVPGSVEQVQGRVRDFLLQKGFSLVAEGEKAGQLETDWRGEDEKAAGKDLDAALKGGLQDKFKLRIEAGRVAGTSEVTVSHLGLQRVAAGAQTQWQPRASDPMLEADMLEQIRAFLASEGTAGSPAGDLPAVKAQVKTDEQGASTLKLNEDFDRAWRRVGIALGRGGFVVTDRNRSEGIYLIRLGTAFKEDAEAGFVSRLFGSNAGNPDEQYRIAVKGNGGETSVVVQHPGGGPVHTGIGGRILDRLKEKME